MVLAWWDFAKILNLVMWVRRFITTKMKRQEAHMMKNITKNNDRTEALNEETGYHKVICGHTNDTMEAEDLELYRFIMGGMQAK